LIVAGPDGNLWFVQGCPPAIGRVTPLGGITSFERPGASGGGEIAAGKDGYLWFVDSNRDKVGRIRP
jgi:virginiamycin B lyase